MLEKQLRYYKGELMWNNEKASRDLYVILDEKGIDIYGELIPLKRANALLETLNNSKKDDSTGNN